MGCSGAHFQKNLGRRVKTLVSPKTPNPFSHVLNWKQHRDNIFVSSHQLNCFRKCTLRLNLMPATHFKQTGSSKDRWAGSRVTGDGVVMNPRITTSTHDCMKDSASECKDRTTADLQNVEDEYWNQPEVRMIILVEWIKLLSNQTILPLSKDPWGSSNSTCSTQLQSIEIGGRCREGRRMWEADEVGG